MVTDRAHHRQRQIVVDVSVHSSMWESDPMENRISLISGSWKRQDSGAVREINAILSFQIKHVWQEKACENEITSQSTGPMQPSCMRTSRFTRRYSTPIVLKPNPSSICARQPSPEMTDPWALTKFVEEEISCSSSCISNPHMEINERTLSSDPTRYTTSISAK